MLCSKSRREDDAVTHGFQQQDTGIGYALTRTQAMPQHGQKCDPKSMKSPKPRSTPPRPGH